MKIVFADTIADVEAEHWIAHSGFNTAIQDFLQHEASAMESHGKVLSES